MSGAHAESMDRSQTEEKLLVGVLGVVDEWMTTKETPQPISKR